MTFDFEDWEQLFEKLTPPTTAAPQQCCDNPYICAIDGHYTCTSCGSLNRESILVVTGHEDNYHIKYQIPYKRIVYFKQKLGFLCCRYWFEENAKLLYFINTLRSRSKRTSLPRIKKMMKRAGLNKYYKHIYSIYQAAYGEPLLTVSSQTYYRMLFQFIEIEKIFKKKKIQKKNMYSYNVILFFLLKLNHIPNFHKIVMPCNKSKLKKIVGSLVQELNG